MTTQLEIDKIDYMIEHPEIVRSFARRQKRSKRFNSKRARDRQFIIDRDGDGCYYCDIEFSNEVPPTIDHYFPEAFCRANGMPKALWDNVSNKVLACESCNQLKSCSIPKMEYYYAWLYDLILNHFTNPNQFISLAVIELAKEFVTRRTFILPVMRDSASHAMLDRETMALDNSFEC